jgi:hypothetical protein
MGFLESIVKRQVRRIVNKAVDEVVDNTVGAVIRDSFGQNGREGKQNFGQNDRERTQRYTQNTVSQAEQRRPGPSGERGLRMRLTDVFAQDFPDYEVRQNLDAGVYGARKYSYGLYYNGIPRMMIMILDNSNEGRLKEVRLAREASASYGVPYLDFYAHLPNEMEYVRNRIRANM